MYMPTQTLNRTEFNGTYSELGLGGDTRALQRTLFPAQRQLQQGRRWLTLRDLITIQTTDRGRADILKKEIGNHILQTEGILQFVEITLNILVLVCIGAAQASISGFTSMGGLGSFNINSAYSPFEGVELQEVRDLDMQFNQMRAPCVYGGVAFSLTLLCLTILFLVAGGKPIHRLSVRLLVTECVFDVLACLAYIVAVGLYLHFVLQVNATEVCKKRERLYARRGYTSMNCSVQGGDASVALFGLLVACLYFASTVVCFLTIRSVREFQRQAAKVQYSLERTYSEGDQHKAYKRPESIDGARTFATLV
uniref:MARVEL domain-containing protein 3-like n=1 Tax=Podarcis muralis TaxID=64176 RepID=UPI00109F5DC9|nr:MARVEL domain-containing protein 3-like [Podarcis muralis]